MFFTRTFYTYTTIFPVCGPPTQELRLSPKEDEGAGTFSMPKVGVGKEKSILSRSTPVAQSATRNLLTRWDVSSIPANGIFLTKNQKTKIKMPNNGWRTINSLVHKIRLHGRRGKGMAESFSRQKSRHAPQKDGGLKILCDLPPV